MTEMSPVGTTAVLKAKHAALDAEARLAIRAKQGRPLFGVEMKIVDDDGRELPHDGKSVGELLVRGPWIVGAYYEDAEATAAAVEPDGWFHTGDVATIDPDGYLQLTDRRRTSSSRAANGSARSNSKTPRWRTAMSARRRRSRCRIRNGASGRC